MRMIIRNTPVAWIFSICIVLITACSKGVVSESASSSDLADIAGSYRLISVNGNRIPARVAQAGDIHAHAGEFIIRADASIRSATTFSPPTGGKITRVTNATLSRQGNKLTMRWKGAGTTTGVIADQTFTMDNHGMILVYQRSTQADEAELKSPRPTATVQRAWPGVFDDFESALVNGWDVHGNTVGFFTFTDSAQSQSSIATTTEHPQRPGQSDNNQVLELKLNVKAWAGVIHRFESADVDRWIARDWRRFNSLSFWLYGNNSNTSLYVEFMDNRNPDSVTGAAELFTYTFTDNFSGWKLITIPFNEFFRKDIGNDAPNDGQGLAEVHGWAFGSLNTNGPISFYLDDFQLR